MVDSQVQFERRIDRLTKKHQAMARGYSARMRSDGLIEIKPRRAHLRFSPRGLFLFIAAFVVFKAFLLANLGADTYDQRVSRLQEGTAVEKAGAFVMQIDPLSQFVAGHMGRVLR